MMKTLFALLALGASSVASASCYLIYTPANELVWRSTTPPVAMDTHELNAAVEKKVPRGHLIVNNDAVPCPVLDLTGPRLTMRQKAAQLRGE